MIVGRDEIKVILSNPIPLWVEGNRISLSDPSKSDDISWKLMRDKLIMNQQH